MDRSAIAWRGEYGAADKPVNAKFLPDTALLKRAATLPTRLQLPQLVSNFERIRNIDFRRRDGSRASGSRDQRSVWLGSGQSLPREDVSVQGGSRCSARTGRRARRVSGPDAQSTARTPAA